MTAYSPGTVAQQTAFEYGVGTSTGSGVSSNELLCKVRFAEPTSGSPSTSSDQQEFYAYDAQGQMTLKQQRAGTTQQYAFDSLGRLRADRSTTTGSGVDAICCFGCSRTR